jgi:arabinose-5-phosphate isomerase
MASTAATMAMGDALAAALMTRKGFGIEDFARFHPGGRLGRQLLRVEALMHAGEEVPSVGLGTPMREAILEMTRRKLGCTAVVDGRGRLAGLITDGDLRRLMQKESDPLELPVDEVMTPGPVTIDPEALASGALKIMEERKITMLPVVGKQGELIGLLQIHDLWRIQLF